MDALIATIFYLSGNFAQNVTVINDHNSYWMREVETATELKTKIYRTIRRSDFAPELNTLAGWQHKKASRVKAFIQRHGTKGLKLVYLPPIIERDGMRYIAGLADLCKPRTGTALVWSQDANQNGDDRRFSSQVVAAHEVGHVLGARHDNELQQGKASIMNSYASGLAHSSITFSRHSQVEMKGCLAINRFYGRKKERNHSN